MHLNEDQAHTSLRRDKCVLDDLHLAWMNSLLLNQPKVGNARLAYEGRISNLAVESQSTAIFAFFSQVIHVLVIDADHVDCMKPESFGSVDNVRSCVQELSARASSNNRSVCAIWRSLVSMAVCLEYKTPAYNLRQQTSCKFKMRQYLADHRLSQLRHTKRPET